MMKILTGIGSRKTPADVLDLMCAIAYKRAKEGWFLRSGGADGADTAFEVGFKTYCVEHHIPFEERMCIYLPWAEFNGRIGKEFVHPLKIGLTQINNAIKCAEKVHPAFHTLTHGAIKMHTRNIFQVRGHLETGFLPDEIIYWTKGVNEPVGGTRTAVKFAEYLGLKTQNLSDPVVRKKYELYVSGFDFGG